MNRKKKHTIINAIFLVVLSVLLVGNLYAFDQWSQWRGTNRDGIAGNIFPASWPNALTRKWQIQVGEGQSSPVVWNDIAYTFTREGQEEVTRAINITTGKVLWRSSYPAPYKVYSGAASFGTGPRSTPVIFQNKLFTLGISGILSAFDAQTGALKWQKKFDGRFPEAAPPFGASMSPLAVGDLLIAHVGGHEGGALTAFEIETGNEKWSFVGEGPSYSSPILIEVSGVKQIVAQAHRKIISVDLTNGKLLWSIPFVTPCDQNIVTPLLAGDLLIFSSLDTGTFAVRVQKNNEEWSTNKVWEINEISMYMSSPLYMDGKIIGMSHRKQGEFFAIDAKSGSIIWTSSPKIAENAAFLANEKSILILKDDGEIQILDSNAKNFEPIRTYKVSDSSTWAHPVPISQGILIKNDDSLILLEYDSNRS
jgi:outer membrane protein assembly factor BamB